MIVHTAEKKQIKYFAQNQLGKITFFYVQTAASLSCCCHNLLLFKLWSLAKDFSPFRELQGLEMYYTMNDHHIR